VDPYSTWTGKRVLVTGGAGAIGSNLSRKLVELGARVTILDDLSAAAEWNIPAGATFIHGDILDDSARSKALAAQPSVIFHLAALFANQNSIDNKERDLMVNGMGTLRLLEDARRLKLERFVYASSGCSVYGDSPLPLKEEFLSLRLSTPYQITKMLGELYCNFFFEQYGLPCTRARLFNSYGPGEIPGRYRNVIPNFIFWAMNGEPLPITGTGEETRDFTFVGDIVDGLLRCAVSPNAVGREFNLGSGTETSVRTIADCINQLTGNTSGITERPRRPWDTKSRLLSSIDRARAELNFAPQTKIEAGLATTVEWFRQNWQNIQASARF
jgi:UDP-glucose 4-epimerase